MKRHVIFYLRRQQEQENNKSKEFQKRIVVLCYVAVKEQKVNIQNQEDKR